MPVLESDVCVGEIHEQRLGLDAIVADRAFCRAFTFESRVAITIQVSFLQCLLLFATYLRPSTLACPLSVAACL